MRVKLKIYWANFKYIVIHKWYFFCAAMGWKMPIAAMGWKMPIAAITHDLSKFLPSEFFAYADKFHSGDYAYRYFEVEGNFEKAWLLHQRRNKHHWDYWVNSQGKSVPMPRKYVKQMICDWESMGCVFGDNAYRYYKSHKHLIKLHYETKQLVEFYLDLLHSEGKL